MRHSIRWRVFFTFNTGSLERPFVYLGESQLAIVQFVDLMDGSSEGFRYTWIIVEAPDGAMYSADVLSAWLEDYRPESPTPQPKKYLNWDGKDWEVFNNLTEKS